MIFLCLLLAASSLAGPDASELTPSNRVSVPVLSDAVVIPNGGIFRFFDFGGFKKENVPRFAVPFWESEYQVRASVTYDRLNWFEFEEAEGRYLFDRKIEPLLQQCLKDRSRLFLGCACNCGEMSVTQMHRGRALAVPVYVFERCADEGFPFRPCDQYGPSWVPDYDSAYLLERHRAMLLAFSRWLEGCVKGTGIPRKNVLYGIEVRYAGYWGEGAMRPEHYPKTDLFDRYVETYVESFPDTLLCLGGLETNHLPTRRQYEADRENPYYVRAMAHVGKLFQARNRRGPLGFFIDSWQSPNDLYDVDSPRVLFAADGKVKTLSETFFGEVYGRRYITGEFGYLTFLSDPNLEPYERLCDQIVTRGVSGISLHNFTAKDRASLIGVKRVRGDHYLPGGLPLSDRVYRRAQRGVAMIGYRIVLLDPCVCRDGTHVKASFSLANIGVSRVYHDYNRLHLMARDAQGRLVEDRRLSFDLKSLEPSGTPLVVRPERMRRMTELFKPEVHEVSLVIPDEQGIEYPLCLSNRGRRQDGSYVLGVLEDRK